MKRSDETRAKISAARTGHRYPERVKPSIFRPCQHCAAIMEFSGRRRHRAKVQRFCDWTCYRAWITEHPEEHPTFIDGGSRSRNRGENWREQAAMARERDGYMCQICGLHRMKPALPVHHIRPLREFRGDWVTANDLSNLLTVCPVCHKTLEPLDSR